MSHSLFLFSLTLKVNYQHLYLRDLVTYLNLHICQFQHHCLGRSGAIRCDNFFSQIM